MKGREAKGAAARDAGAFVWVPGWGMPPAVWAPVWPHLAYAAVHVAVDWAGCRAPGDFSHVVRAAVSQAREAGGGPVTVVAWSLGSLVTLSMARDMARDVAALVLVGATARFVAAPDWPHGWDERALRRFARRFARDPASTWRAFVDDLFAPGERVEEPDPRRRLLRAPPVDDALAALAFLAACDARGDLAHCRVPVRLLHGSADAVCPLSGARALAGALPNARLTVWCGAGHAPHVARPRAFARWLAAELAALRRADDATRVRSGPHEGAGKAVVRADAPD
ncbi:alpha/beta fold hydrolase [Calditerricola satsumensis]|uniref:O-methylpimelyl-ACP methylesterase n=1 Tax=Calditerricola satsumensis TaxID=373054 RepID=A0A8J3BDK8_9BACI|nr:alpha/beta fold hydrolase [Calditerricola satsumensis]GGJ99262.1 O-methylpimelyl-ACP methylesterase [Calditerricola satsumensis]